MTLAEYFSSKIQDRSRGALLVSKIVCQYVELRGLRNVLWRWLLIADA
jgi:hypothetical protein